MGTEPAALFSGLAMLWPNGPKLPMGHVIAICTARNHCLCSNSLHAVVREPCYQSHCGSCLIDSNLNPNYTSSQSWQIAIFFTFMSSQAWSIILNVAMHTRRPTVFTTPIAFIEMTAHLIASIMRSLGP